MDPTTMAKKTPLKKSNDGKLFKAISLFIIVMSFTSIVVVHVKVPRFSLDEDNGGDASSLDFSTAGYTWDTDGEALNSKGLNGEALNGEPPQANNTLSEKNDDKKKQQQQQRQPKLRLQDQEKEQWQQQNNTKAERFAYVHLIAGCNPKNPSYLGYIYNIIVSKRILLDRGSKEDVVVMVRMYAESEYMKLPPEHEEILTKSGVVVKYLPKPHIDNFHTAMLDKFSILKLTEYSRVLYLDADALVLHNLDYMFHSSSGPNPKLEENAILAYKGEPANGGFFMLKPDEQDYEDLMAIVKETEKNGYHFNETIGFGHVITPPDYWESYKGEGGTKWNWHGAFTDQGLLYHWTKYAKKKVSIIVKDKVQKWGANENGESYMIEERDSKEIFGPAARHVVLPNGHIRFNRPYSDFEHYTGSGKPWLPFQVREHVKNPPGEIERMDVAKNTKDLWYYVLEKVNKDHKLGIDISKIDVGRPTLGLFPTNKMVHQSNEARTQKET